MNTQLFDAWHSLTDPERMHYRSKFQDAPMTLELMNFLEQTGKRKFRTPEAVSWIYREEKDNEPLPKLQNRYYKLRKQLLDEISSPQDEVRGILTDEELKLTACREMIRKNEQRQAFRELVRLEKVCRMKNLFELLPEVISHIIYCNQVFNQFAENEGWMEKLEEATDMHACLWRQRLISQRAYHMRVQAGKYEVIRNEIRNAKTITDKYPEYPRFMMNYLFIMSRLGTGPSGTRIHTVQRQLNRLKVMMQQHPEIPLLQLEAGHEILNRIRVINIDMMLAFRKQDNVRAYEQLMQYWTLVETSASGLYSLTENDYLNRIRLEIALLKYAEAEETIQKLIRFLKDNNKLEHLPVAYTEMARIQVFAYPVRKPHDFEMLDKKLEEYRKVLIKAGAPLQALEIDCLRVSLHFINRKYETAHELFESRGCEKYYRDFGLEYTKRFYEIPLIRSASEQKAAIAALEQEIKDELSQPKVSGAEHTDRLFLRLLMSLRRRG